MTKRIGMALMMALLMTGAAWAEAVVHPKIHYSQVARQFARTFPSAHVQQMPLDDTLSARAWTNYLSALDYDRMYFTAEDIKEFSGERARLDDQLREGSMQFAFDVFDVYRERVRNRYAYVTNQLAAGFDFSLDESYAWKRKDRPWPAGAEERDELWRLRLKNEYLGYIVSKSLDAAERTNALAVATNQLGAASTAGGAATNKTVAAEVTPAAVSTNGVAKAVVEPPPPPTPEEFVRKRYKQYLIMLEDTDSEWVLQKFMGAVAGAYDPHSSYMSPTTYEDFDIEMKLSLVGIGALLRSEDGTAKIVRMIPGGPADQDERDVRLQPNDKIIGVGQGDGEIVDVLHWPLYKTVRLIRGEKGTKVVLHVISASDPTGATTRYVDLVRDEVKLEDQAATSATHAVQSEEGRELTLGVIDLPTFYANMKAKRVTDPGYRSASYDVGKLLGEFNEAGVNGVVLDLRNNGGGSLREAIDMVGLFVRTGPVVQVKERRTTHVIPDRDPAVAFRKPMIVLVNRLSASASEIVAGALQDYGRAVIVGDSSTHGKGTVQTILPLSSDPRLGSIKVTTASYYRVNGASTQVRGVTPDIVISSSLDHLDLGEKFLPFAVPWTRVTPATYEPVAYLSDLIQKLRMNSFNRRMVDDRFRQHAKLLDRVETISQTREITLNLEARKAMALEEREIRKLRDAEMDKSDEDDSERRDLVLDESLNILADLVELQGPIKSLNVAQDQRMEIGDVIQRVFAP